jgi:hypothetical protein
VDGENRSLAKEGVHGLVRNRRQAVSAFVITLIVLALEFRTVIARHHAKRWLFDPINNSYLFGRGASIALSIFFWCFVACMLFSLYRAARDKTEQFLIGGFAVGYILGVISGFLSPSAQINLQLASIAADLVSFASSLTILAKWSDNSIEP